MVSEGKRFEVTASELAEKIGGRLVGDPEVVVTRVATIQDADEQSVTFLSNPRYYKYLETTRAGVILVNQGVEAPGKTLIVVDDPYLAFARILTMYAYSPPEFTGISDNASISKDAKVGEGVSVGAFSVVESGAEIGSGTFVASGVHIGKNVKVGRDCIIYPGVVIREESVIGDRVILQPGVVIGGDGFGFVPRPGGHYKIPQIGRVVIGNDVEIGANSTVDRGAIGDTVIGDGTKIDNLVQIGHNVIIGKHCLIAAQVGIAGSAKIGDYVMIGGQTGIAGHIEIGSGVQIAAKSGVHASIKEGSIVGGSPAVPHKEWLKINVVWKKLPQLWEKVRNLEKKL